MRITIVDVQSGIPEDELQKAVHAIERQVHEDFAAAWGMDARLRAVASEEPLDPLSREWAQSDAVIYVGRAHGDPTVVDVLLHHQQNVETPWGHVPLVDDGGAGPAHWSVRLSHEVLALIANPDLNLFALGPHPDGREAGGRVLWAYEVCAPVGADWYLIDSVKVCNFVTPRYFAMLGANVPTNHMRLKLAPFQLRPGGSCPYVDQAGILKRYPAGREEVARGAALDVGASRFVRLASFGADPWDPAPRPPGGGPPSSDPWDQPPRPPGGGQPGGDIWGTPRPRPPTAEV